MFYLDTKWLGLARLRLIANPPRGQEKQGHQGTPSHLWIVMRAGPRARPALALPAAHAHYLRARCERHYTVDLAIGMGVVLATVLLDALHVDGRDAEVAVLGARP